MTPKQVIEFNAHISKMGDRLFINIPKAIPQSELRGKSVKVTLMVKD